MARGLLSNALHMLVLFNGMYDLLCFMGIMWFHSLPGFSSFHLSIFREEDDRRHPLVRRLLAYWILTYGMVRVLAGAVDHESHALDAVAAMTYFIEAFGFEYELCVEETVIRSKVTAITLMSLPIAMGLMVMTHFEKPVQ